MRGASSTTQAASPPAPKIRGSTLATERNVYLKAWGNRARRKRSTTSPTTVLGRAHRRGKRLLGVVGHSCHWSTWKPTYPNCWSMPHSNAVLRT